MKLKHTLLLLLCIFSILPETFAQKGFSVGFSGAYLHSFRRLKVNDDDTYTQKDLDYRNDTESPLGARQFSLDFMYNYKNNVNISFGMSHSNTGYQIKDYPFYSSSAPSVDNLVLQYRFMRITLPIMFGYKLALGKEHKQALLFRLGFNNHINYAVSTAFIVNYKNGGKDEQKETELALIFPYNLSACANIGYYYQLKKHHIGLSLIGDYGLTALDGTDYSISDYLYNWGIGLSYFYAFH